jgi:hypothetical protein
MSKKFLRNMALPSLPINQLTGDFKHEEPTGPITTPKKKQSFYRPGVAQRVPRS